MKSIGTLQAGTGLWQDPNTAATNESGFTGLPGGYRSLGGTFVNIGYHGDWWSSSEVGTTYAWNRLLLYNTGIAGRAYFEKYFGFSVRCLKD
jgi:uncharacterized protein (TIGR02145 family)